MKNESIVRLMAGTLVLVGVLLSRTVHPNWIWLDVFVGLNLAQSALTGFCPAEIVIRRIRGGGGPGCAGC
ncbi:MAG: DUF2892 domain-containing protein [Verrucomicrobia bacterium]|nr:MAG: DUF2892 domain-containing protein [Verrucomicrobiota bacterium]